MPPVVMLVSQAQPDFALLFSMMGVLSLGGVHLILRRVIRERGEKCKERLNEQYQGRPAIELLIKESASATRRLRYREAIAHLASQRGLPFPSRSEDRDDATSVAKKYAATLGHIEATLNLSKKPDLSAARTEFDFLLNCLALRWIGLTVAIGALLFSQASVSLGVHPHPQLALGMLPHSGSTQMWLVPAMMIPVWLFFFTPGRVRAAQEQYDRLLLVSVVCVCRNRGLTRLGSHKSRGVGSKAGNRVRHRRSKRTATQVANSDKDGPVESVGLFRRGVDLE